jgi:predicted amidohydrolase
MGTVISCGQFAPVPGDIPANTAVMKRQAIEAAGRGAALIVFPELCLSGYLPAAEIKPFAVTRDGAEMARLSEAAKEAGISLCFGFAEKRPDGALSNSMAFIDAGGALLCVYRKVHLFGAEGEWAAAGDGFACLDAGPFRLGMWICYDTRFPETARAVALAGATLGLAGSAWLGPGEEWELALRARALDNGMYVAGAAIQGASGPFAFHGTSLIADPHGGILARAVEGREEVICAAYEPEEVKAFRARLPLIEHRRPDAYGTPGNRGMDGPAP